MSETFFATIIGALAAFLGVLMTLRTNQRNFETNLREEREKARREREFLAKHKALVSALEAVTRFINYYITLPDRELPKDGNIAQEVAEMGVALNGLHFYCGIETIKSSINMGQILSASFSKVLKAKIPSLFINENIKAIDLEVRNLESINNQLQQEVLALLSSGSSNPLLVSLKEESASNFNKLAKLNEKKFSLMKEKYLKTEVCRDVMSENLQKVYEAAGNVLLMARRELAFPIDESLYVNILEQSSESALFNMKSLLDEIRLEVSKKLQGN